MKFFVVSMMVFLLSLSVAIIGEMDAINYNQAYQKDWVDYINSTNYQNQSYGNAPVEAGADSGSDIFTDFRIAMNIFGKSLYYSTVGFPFMLNSFGVPKVVAFLVALPLWMMYFAAIIQLLLRFGFAGSK